MTDSSQEGALFGCNRLDDLAYICQREARQVATDRARRQREEPEDDQRRADFVCSRIRRTSRA